MSNLAKPMAAGGGERVDTMTVGDRVLAASLEAVGPCAAQIGELREELARVKSQAEAVCKTHEESIAMQQTIVEQAKMIEELRQQLDQTRMGASSSRGSHHSLVGKPSFPTRTSGSPSAPRAAVVKVSSGPAANDGQVYVRGSAPRRQAMPKRKPVSPVRRGIEMDVFRDFLSVIEAPIQQVVSQIDVRKTGMLRQTDFISRMEILHYPGDARALWRELDVYDNGVISREELLDMMSLSATSAAALQQRRQKQQALAARRPRPSTGATQPISGRAGQPQRPPSPESRPAVNPKASQDSSSPPRSPTRSRPVTPERRMSRNCVLDWRHLYWPQHPPPMVMVEKPEKVSPPRHYNPLGNTPQITGKRWSARVQLSRRIAKRQAHQEEVRMAPVRRFQRQDNCITKEIVRRPPTSRQAAAFAAAAAVTAARTPQTPALNDSANDLEQLGQTDAAQSAPDAINDDGQQVQELSEDDSNSWSILTHRKAAVAEAHASDISLESDVMPMAQETDECPSIPAVHPLATSSSLSAVEEHQEVDTARSQGTSINRASSKQTEDIFATVRSESSVGSRPAAAHEEPPRTPIEGNPSTATWTPRPASSASKLTPRDKLANSDNHHGFGQPSWPSSTTHTNCPSTASAWRDTHADAENYQSRESRVHHTLATSEMGTHSRRASKLNAQHASASRTASIDPPTLASSRGHSGAFPVNGPERVTVPAQVPCESSAVAPPLASSIHAPDMVRVSTSPGKTAGSPGVTRPLSQDRLMAPAMPPAWQYANGPLLPWGGMSGCSRPTSPNPPAVEESHAAPTVLQGPVMQTLRPQPNWFMTMSSPRIVRNASLPTHVVMRPTASPPVPLTSSSAALLTGSRVASVSPEPRPGTAMRQSLSPDPRLGTLPSAVSPQPPSVFAAVPSPERVLIEPIARRDGTMTPYTTIDAGGAKMPAAVAAPQAPQTRMICSPVVASVPLQFASPVRRDVQLSPGAPAAAPGVNTTGCSLTDELFTMVDCNHDGLIDRIEFRQAMKANIISRGVSRDNSAAELPRL